MGQRPRMAPQGPGCGAAAQPDPGRVTIRRLNREEYHYTILDMFGVDFDTTDPISPVLQVVSETDTRIAIEVLDDAVGRLGLMGVNMPGSIGADPRIDAERLDIATAVIAGTLDFVPIFEAHAHDPLVRFMSLMDHAPGQRQFASLDSYRGYYQGKRRMSAEQEDEHALDQLSNGHAFRSGGVPCPRRRSPPAPQASQKPLGGRPQLDRASCSCRSSAAAGRYRCAPDARCRGPGVGSGLGAGPW